MSMTTFDFEQLTKTVLTRVAALLGERADWARVAKDDVISMIEAHEYDDQIKALREVGCTDEDIENLTIDGNEDVVVGTKEAIAAMVSGESQTVTSKETITAKKEVLKPAPTDSEQISQIAALLAQMMALNKGALDVEAVTKIVAEEMAATKDRFEASLLEHNNNLIDAVEKRLAGIPARKLEVTSNRGTFTVEGRQHKQFAQLVKTVSACRSDGHHTLNVWMTGVPGTGKTTAAHNAAIALGLNFHTNGSIANKYELTGFIDAHGKCHHPEFRKAWEHGGVYLFDEIDGSVPSAVLAFNSALANGIMAFPDGMIPRHKDCIVIAAANTSGQGATAELVGRMKQDAAFLDRFVFLTWMIDEELETHLSEDKAWSQYVQKVRRNVATKGIKVMVTPRATLYGDQLLAAGIDRPTVVDMALKKGMTSDQWAMVQ